MTLSLTRFARGALSTFFFIFYGLFGLLSLPLLLPLLPFPRLIRFLVRSFYRIFVFLAAVAGLFRVSIGDTREIRGKIVVMNHLTLIDIVILMAHLPDSTCVVKGAAAKNPFLMSAVRSMFLVNSGDPHALMTKAKKLLSSGVNLIVFPEGTRTPRDAPNRKIHRGAAWIALESGAEIFPMHLEVDPQVLGKNQKFWDVGDRIIRYNIEKRERIVPTGAATRTNAIELTEKMKEAIS